MAKIPVPAANAPFAVCPHCQQAVKLDPVWYRFLAALALVINQGL